MEPSAKSDDPIMIIGGGLAGSEAACQLARGVRVKLYEMRPRNILLHRTSKLANWSAVTR